MVHQHGDEHHIPHEHKQHRSGAWLPADHRIQKEFVRHHVEGAKKDPKQLMPVLQEFKDFIEGNARIYMLFTAMFDEVPHKHPYNKDPSGHKLIRSYTHLLEVLNHIFSRAPVWTDTAAGVGVVGVPMCSLLDYMMSTPSGHAAFLDPEVNKMLKKVLNSWGKFLQTPESAEVLNDTKTGWFGHSGVYDMMQVANAPYKTDHKFEDMFQCPDPSKANRGFTSWDHFFTRQLTEKARPIADPEDDSIVANACESKVYNVERHVKLRNKFWIKGEPYSIIDMLANDPLSEHFAGGTVYQAFLSALSYHRWHSPISGTVKKAYVVDGTYFSEPLFEGLADPSNTEIDKAGITDGQGYLTALATRAIIFIEADNPAIGLMAFIGVGMDEVSTCEITVREGQHIKKGEQTGMFHFGGSSHVLLFRKEVKIDGFPKPGRSENVPVRGRLAKVTA